MGQRHRSDRLSNDQKKLLRKLIYTLAEIIDKKHFERDDEGIYNLYQLKCVYSFSYDLDFELEDVVNISYSSEESRGVLRCS